MSLVRLGQTWRRLLARDRHLVRIAFDVYCRRRAPRAPSELIVVCACSSATAALKPKDVRLKLVAESEADDVIDLGAPRLSRRRASERRRPGRAVPVPPLYIPNPRLYPGPRTKPKRKQKRTEARSNDGRGRRHKRVFQRPVPNSRLYRPAPPRPPPPPAWPRTTWPPPAPTAALDTASRAALRLSEQRRGHVLQRTAQAARSPAQAARAPAQATRSPAQATRSPAQSTRSPAQSTRSPAQAAPSPAQATRSPAQARRAPVRAPQSPTRACCRLPPQRAREPPPPTHTPPPPAEPVPRYWPTSAHFRLLSLDTDSSATTPVGDRPGACVPRPAAAIPAMDSGNQHSTSPEDCSEGNETLSAPSEFLAEFLSAIMRRQYAEALKYCRLILQYEPHNTTARGFYPLLQHKVQAHKRAEGAWVRGSSSEEASAHADKPHHATEPPGAQEMMEQGADEWGGSAAASRSSSRGSCASQSSLELDSSEAARSSPSRSLSRRTDHTDSASAGCWESSGSASRSEPDDNGNAPPAPPPLPAPPACAADLHNDNTLTASTTLHKSGSPASLRRLRAQFTCSIK